jgi:hypothetical protein
VMTIDDEGIQNALKFDDVIYGRTHMIFRTNAQPTPGGQPPHYIPIDAVCRKDVPFGVSSTYPQPWE